MPNEKKPRETREQIEKRVLEAEKVVVSNILHNWKRKFGMDYLITVRNGPGDVFSRSSLSLGGKDEVEEATLKELSRSMGYEEVADFLNKHQPK